MSLFYLYFYIKHVYTCLTALQFQIEGVDPDNARVVVKLAIGSKTVTISQYGLKLVDRKEYEKYSKDLSKCCNAAAA